MRNITDLADEIRLKIQRLTALVESAEAWKPGEWPDASAANSALADAERMLTRLDAHSRA